MNNYKDWIGKKISRSDIITPRLVDHLKKTIDQNCLGDQSVPEGIFLCLCPDVTSLDDLLKPRLGINIKKFPQAQFDYLNIFDRLFFLNDQLIGE